MGPRSGTDVWDKRQISLPCWDLNHGSSSVYPSHYLCYLRNLECNLNEIFWLDSILLSRSDISSQEYMAMERRLKLLTITILLQL